MTPDSSIKAQSRSASWEWFAFVVLMFVCACVYAPGLRGFYIFDDFPNIVENPEVHVSNSTWQNWYAAAVASPAADLPRPLAMLSFTANYYLTQLDPLPMKITNLVIHLLNGLLLWHLLKLLLCICNAKRASPQADRTIRLATLGVTAAWLLCPINLSPVLYVVQRMESMAQAFVLIGLVVYLKGRIRMLGGKSGLTMCTAALVGCTVLGLLCKETAILLPLYAFLVDWLILNFEANHNKDRRNLYTLFGAVLFVPAVVGLCWLLPRCTSAAAYAGRPFTLAQRLLTECRIVVDYCQWTLFPRPDNLGFYHDDISISQGWLSPATTLFSAIFLAAGLAAALLWRRKLPLVALGITWFFAAHLLTATVIPLELVFEHRNYFSSIGLLLACAALILEIPLSFTLLRVVLPILALVAYSGATALRAMEWSNPIRFAYAEAGEHPKSARALYELGHTLTIASGYRSNSKLIEPAILAFQAGSELPDASAAPLAGLIIVASHMHRTIDPAWWTALARLLSSRSASVDDISALESLTECQRRGECPPQSQELLSAYLAALSHPEPRPALLANYGAFSANALQDYALAARAAQDAVAARPDSIEYRIELMQIQVLNGDMNSAQSELAWLHSARLTLDQAKRVADIQRTMNSSRPEPKHS